MRYNNKRIVIFLKHSHDATVGPYVSVIVMHIPKILLTDEPFFARHSNKKGYDSNTQNMFVCNVASMKR